MVPLERSGKEKKNDTKTIFLALFVTKLSEFIDIQTEGQCLALSEIIFKKCISGHNSRTTRLIKACEIAIESSLKEEDFDTRTNFLSSSTMELFQSKLDKNRRDLVVHHFLPIKYSLVILRYNLRVYSLIMTNLVLIESLLKEESNDCKSNCLANSIMSTVAGFELKKMKSSCL